jgi:hypothetical protein
MGNQSRPKVMRLAAAAALVGAAGRKKRKRSRLPAPPLRREGGAKGAIQYLDARGCEAYSAMNLRRGLRSDDACSPRFAR